jgi:hypothetical protein
MFRFNWRTETDTVALWLLYKRILKKKSRAKHWLTRILSRRWLRRNVNKSRSETKPESAIYIMQNPLSLLSGMPLLGAVSSYRRSQTQTFHEIPLSLFVHDLEIRLNFKSLVLGLTAIPPKLWPILSANLLTSSFLSIHWLRPAIAMHEIVTKAPFLVLS